MTEIKRQQLDMASPPSRLVETAIAPQYLFVYGTLKRGFGNHERYLLSEEYVGGAKVPGLLLHLGSLPALCLDEQPSQVIGEVYKISPRKLLDIDGLEGHPVFYTRVNICIHPFGNVWTYVLAKDRLERVQWAIPCGCWLGEGTPKLKWLGLGKGVEIAPGQRIAVDHRNLGEFSLQKNERAGLFELVSKKTGEIIETYRSVGEMVRSDNKPRISLPAVLTLHRERKAEEQVLYAPALPAPTPVKVPKSFGPGKREA